MARLYTVWDADTRNMLTSARDYADALCYVRDVVREHGAAVADRWGLLWEDDEDEETGGLIAEGKKLADLALHTPLPEREKLAS